MPAPNDKEMAENDRKGFVDRCVPIVIADKTAKDGSQAVAVCNSIWDRAREKRNS